MKINVLLLDFLKRMGVFSIALMLTFSSLPAIGAGVSFEGEILRFHVIANSNSKSDQALKLKVRDRVLEVATTLMEETENAEDAEKIAIQNLTLLREVALDVVNEEGYYYDVSIECGVCHFPVKSYGNVTLPAGNYKAVRIVIGEGEGENWWCVMYPPLCFVNETAQFDKDSLEGLSSETKDVILNEKPKINVKFKLADIFSKLI